MAERETDQKNISLSATNVNSFLSSLNVAKADHTLAVTSKKQFDKQLGSKCTIAVISKERMDRDMQNQERLKSSLRASRPRLTLDGPYRGLLSVDTPPLCSQRHDYELSCLKDDSHSDCHDDGDDLFHNLHQSNLENTPLGLSNLYHTDNVQQRVAVIRPGSNADQEEEDASLGDPDMVIKHPLQNSWAMWFFKNDKTRDWKDNLRVITTFDTVEDFWGLYNHTLPASKLQSGCDYSVFKAGIQPMWEDAQNKKGGRWLINLNKSQRQPHLDDLWLETLLCLIGEGFDEYSDDICGATVNIRTKGDKLGLWTRDASRNDATRKIGIKLKESLNVPPKIVIGFQAHSDTAGKAGSTVKNRFTV